MTNSTHSKDERLHHPDKTYKVKHTVFVDGANFVGKTTWLNREVGEGNYAKDVPTVAVSHALRRLSLSADPDQMNIPPGTIAEIRKRNRPTTLFRSRETVYFDRGPLSSLVYQPTTEPRHLKDIYPDVSVTHVLLTTSPRNLWRNINQSRRTRDWPPSARSAMFANCLMQQELFLKLVEAEDPRLVVGTSTTFRVIRLD